MKQHWRRSLERRLHKLLGRDALIFVKSLDKITFVVKAAGDGGFLYGNISGGQHFAGALNAVVVQIINGSAFRHTTEIPAEISGVHAGNVGQIIQTDGVSVIFGDVCEHIFYRGKAVGSSAVSDALLV